MRSARGRRFTSGLTGSLALIVAAGIFISATAAAQPNPIDYTDYMHWVAGTALPSASDPTTNARSATGGVLLKSNPFLPGGLVAFVANTLDMTGYVTAIDVTDPTALTAPSGDADQIGNVSFFQASMDLAADPRFDEVSGQYRYLYVANQDTDLRVVRVSGTNGSAALTLEVVASMTGQSWPNGPNPNDPCQDANALELQTRGASVYAIVSESGCSTFGPGFLRTYDVTSPESPVLVNTLNLGIGTSGDMVLNGGYAYISGAVGDGKVVDIQDPLHPFVVRSLGVPYSGGMALSGNYLYVNARSLPFWVLDVSVPDNPVPVYGADPGAFNPFEAQGGRLAVVGNTVYTANVDGLVAIDVTTPASPQLLGTAEASGLGVDDHGYLDYGVAIDGNHAYVSSPSEGLQVVDITNNLSPTPLSNAVGPSVSKLAISGTTLLTGGSAFQVFDIASNPPQLLATGAHGTGDVALLGDKAYMQYGCGFRIYDLSNRSAPVLLGEQPYCYNGREFGDLAAYQSAADGRTYVLQEGGPRLIGTYDVTDPGNIIEKPFPIRMPVQPGNIYDMQIVCDRLYVSSDRGLMILSLADPTDATLLGWIERPIGEFTVVGERVYAINGNFLTSANGLDVIDVSNPAIPTVVGTAPLRTREGGGAYDVWVSNGRAYVAYGGGGMFVIDVTTPANPRFLGSVNPIRPGDYFAADDANYAPDMDVVVAAGRAYLADGPNGLYALPLQSGGAPDPAPAGPALAIQAPSSATFTEGCGAVQLGSATASGGCGVVQITNDAPETFPVGETVVTWTATDGAGTTATAQQTITILPYVAPTIAIAGPAAVTVLENTGSVLLTVTRTGGTCGDVSVAFATTDGTAHAGTDFTTTSGTLSWADGDSSPRTITVPILNNADFDGDRTFTVSLGGPTGGAVLVGAIVSVTVQNDDVFTPGTIAIAPAAFSVSESAGSATVTLSRAGGANGAVSVSLYTTDGTALNGTDYANYFTPEQLVVSWADGDASDKTFSFGIIDNLIPDGDRGFTVGIADPTGGATLAVGATLSVVTIQNDDTAGPEPATITPIRNQVLAEGEVRVVAVQATDPDGGDIALSATLPAFATLQSPTSGYGTLATSIRLAPGLSDAGVYTATVTEAGGDIVTFTITVTEVNGSSGPVVVAPPTATVSAGAALTFNVSASDPDGDPIQRFVVVPSPGGPLQRGAQFVAAGLNTPLATGTFTWTPTAADVGSYSVVFRASNECPQVGPCAKQGTDTTIVTVTQPNQPATIDPIADQVIAEGATASVPVYANDPDGDVVSLSASLPGFATLQSPTSGSGNVATSIALAPGFSDAGSYPAAVSEAGGVSVSFTITVTNADRGPVLSAPASVTAPERSLLTVDVSASDPDGEPIEALTADLSGLPAGHDGQFAIVGDPLPALNASGRLTWTPTCRDADGGGNYVVTFTASNALAATATTAIHVENVGSAASLAALPDVSVAEGATLVVPVDATDADGDAVILSATVPVFASFAAGSSTPGHATATIDFAPGYSDAGSYPVHVMATQGCDAEATADFTVTVTPANRPPAIDPIADQTLDENSAVDVATRATDPDGDVVTLSATLPSFAALTTAPAAGTATGTIHIAPGSSSAGDYTAIVHATDAGGAPAADVSFNIHVDSADRAPVVVAPATWAGSIGAALDFTVTASDPDGDAIASLTASPLPSGASFTPAGGNLSGAFHWVPGPGQSGSYSVTFTAQNALSGAATTNISIANPNAAPIVTITGPASGSVYPVGTAVALSGSFTDDPGDTHTARWTLDATNVTGTVNESARTVSASYTFTAPGVYNVSLTVTDNLGQSGSASTIAGLSELIVVYDPSAGFVTGGGYINSPAGAYLLDPSLTGKANFGFVSKYKKGQSIPSGETEFQFKAGNLNFHSDVYEWLVVSSPRAQYKGTGTINGGGNYGFLLTAIDGQLTGGGGIDKFRMKIWDKNAGGAIVYDNQLGASDNANPTTALAGGSIVIHTTGSAVASMDPTAGSPAAGYELSQNYPNPFNPSTSIAFSTSDHGRVRLAVFDSRGRLVAILVDQVVSAGRHEVRWDGRDSGGRAVASGVYHYRCEADGVVLTRQMILLK